jgi:hypothetical protein
MLQIKEREAVCGTSTAPGGFPVILIIYIILFYYPYITLVENLLDPF